MTQNDGRSKGGKARNEKLTPARKSAIAREGARAKWKDRPAKASHAGTLKLGDMTIACANLPGGVRVVSEAAMMTALGRGYSGYYSQRDAAADPGTAVLPRYLAPAVLKPFLSAELASLQPIPYVPPGGTGAVAKGVNAEALPQICDVWLNARAAGVLSTAQLRTAAKAEILVRGLARVGIIALVDEATGYQLDRAQTALADILERFISNELAAYAKLFKAEYYQHIYRLRQWKGDPLSGRRPQVGKWTADIVYARLAPGVLTRLREVTPRDGRGRLTHKYFQRLTEETGVPALREHLASVYTLMSLSTTWDDFLDKLDRRHPRLNDTLLLPFAKVDEE
jgi:hypothetical protein